LPYFRKFSEKMAFNVPAVYDVLARAHKAMRSIAAGQNAAEKTRAKAVG
jgi:hypothetical protein